MSQQSCPSKESLVTVLYGEATAAEEQAVRAHLVVCVPCREEFAGWGDVRQSLEEWHTPVLPAHFRLVSEPAEAEPAPTARVIAGPARWWATRQAAWAGLAAAAVLVLGVSAGLANLDVTVGAEGLRIRTGRGAHVAQEAAAPAAVPAAVASQATPSTGAPADAAWRTELAALEQRLREDMNTRVAASSGPSVALAASRASDDVLLRRMQALIDDSETRQQRNLALRVTELARDFDVQRKADFVQIQQGLGRAEAEAARTQQMMNYLVRTASSTPR